MPAGQMRQEHEIESQDQAHVSATCIQVAVVRDGLQKELVLLPHPKTAAEALEKLERDETHRGKLKLGLVRCDSDDMLELDIGLDMSFTGVTLPWIDAYFGILLRVKDSGVLGIDVGLDGAHIFPQLPSALMYRECYAQLLEELKWRWQDAETVGRDQSAVIIAGNSGIGKSAILPFIIAAFAAIDNRFHFIVQIDEAVFILLHRDGCRKLPEHEASVKLGNPRQPFLIYICDGYKPLSTNVKTVLTGSPDRHGHVKFHRSRAAATMHMGHWDLNELLTVARADPRGWTSSDDLRVTKRFTFFGGGNARAVLHKNRAGDPLQDPFCGVTRDFATEDVG